MWILHGKFEDEPTTDLAKAAHNKRGFSAAFLLPDTRDVLESRNEMQVAHNDRINQQFLEEDIQKHSKADSRVLCPSSIHHRTSVEGCCANMVAMMKTITKFDDTVMTGNDAPLLAICARRIALITSSAQFRRYQARNSELKKTQLNYYGFGVLDKCMAHVARGLRSEPMIRAASNENASSINLECITLACNVLQTGLETMASIISDAEAIEVTVLFENSEFNRRALAKANKFAPAAGERATGKRKITPTEEDSYETPEKTPGRAKNVGAIKYTGKGAMPMPGFALYPKGQATLCGATVRDNTRGCRTPGCKLDHAEHTKWPKPVKALMMAHVDKTPGMNWNDKIVTAKWLGLKLNTDKASGVDDLG